MNINKIAKVSMTKTEIINRLLELQIIKVDPQKEITFASGIKSIVYCDNRKIIAHPELRAQVIDLLADIVKTMQFDAIVGTATAGIPWASYLSLVFNTRNGYVRSKAKDHGTKSMVEGLDPKGLNIILIEDLITTGESVIKAAQHLLAEGAKTVTIVSIFSYQFKLATSNFAINHLKYVSGICFEDLLSVIKSQYSNLYDPLIGWWRLHN